MRAVIFAALLLGGCLLGGCRKAPAPEASTRSASPPPPAPPLEILFTYGSEKENWVKEVTADFNASHPRTATGRSIAVKALPLGSGECIDSLLDGSIQADLTSPASAAFVKLGNARSRAQTGQDLLPATDNLVLSPVVIAMWKPMADALGWPGKPVGWSDILALASSPQGWGGRGFPQWGQFKFGHTHPQFSNSGLISLLAEVYAATGKKAGLTPADLQNPPTAAYLAGIERSVVHYGSSTGFFGKKMFANGPAYLSAAVLYENMVIESYTGPSLQPFPLVAIYPKEGTFWSDHPAGIVARPWVTPEKREAAQRYLNFLQARPQQEKALRYGFRPALPEIPLAAPVDAAHGVNPREPQTTLEVPGAEIMAATERLWQENKKHARITLVFDVSGSMRDGNKIGSARDGALELLKQIDDADSFALLPFNNQLLGTTAPLPLGSARPLYEQQIGGLFPNGGTALYDAVDAAFQQQMADRQGARDQISAVVVLTDGQDTDSRLKLDDLLRRIRSDGENRDIRVFTIGYGQDAEAKVLEQIANATQAKYYRGTPENIREVFRDISTFF